MKADRVGGHDDYCFRLVGGATSLREEGSHKGHKGSRRDFGPQISGTLGSPQIRKSVFICVICGLTFRRGV
jgi:hypothetical protein